MAQVGLLLPSLRTHPLWKYAHHRPGILRYAWDYIPHGRNQAKYASNAPAVKPPDSSIHESLFPESLTPLDSQVDYSPPAVLPIPSAGCGDPDLPTAAICPLCYAGFDDYHHLLVECSHKELCERRQRIIRSLQVQAALASKDLPTAVGAYIDKFLGCLLQPDPKRLSHSIWLMRPFLPTLQAIDATMSHKEYNRNVLVPLADAIPNLMRQLFEEVAPLWRRRCDLLALRARSAAGSLLHHEPS